MENIDIIIVAGVSFLLVVGGLFIGMYFARRTEAARVAKLEEREDRLLRMRARFEHERFAVSAEDSDEDVLFDEDLFKGFKEELEQERMELEMRREELELDMRMLEEENDRLKSRLIGPESVDEVVRTNADDALIVEEATTESRIDIEDAVFDEPSEDMETDDVEVHSTGSDPEPVPEPEDASEVEVEPTDEDRFEDEAAPETIDDAEDSDADNEDRRARNTIFGDFYFDNAPEDDDSGDDDLSSSAERDAEPDDVAEEEDETDPVDDGWASEPDAPDEIEQQEVPALLTESVGGDGAAGDRHPDDPPTSSDTRERNEPARPAFDHMFTSDGEVSADETFEQVLGLSKSDLALMNDLGYGTFRSIADLGEEEIERLAEAFDIPEQIIRDEWIPASRTRVAREPRA